jgi:hypothetical protein
LQIKTEIISCHTADSKPVKQEVNGRMILPPLVLPDQSVDARRFAKTTLGWYYINVFELFVNQGVINEGEDSLQLTDN